MDEANIYIALKGKIRSLIDSAKLSIELGDGKKFDFIITSSCLKNEITVCSSDFIEISIPKNIFTAGTFDLIFSITKNGETLQNFPLFGTLTIDIERTYSDNWYI